MALPLFDPPLPPRVRTDSPCYFVYWQCFRQGREGQAFTYRDEDPEIARYALDGHRIGRLFRPLPCMKETR
jgi:hypothetical protein